MQVPYLTDSHINMIETVKGRHDRVLILLGVKDKIDLKNPLDFNLRRQMIMPLMRVNDIIVPLKDIPDDNPAWAKSVDNLVSAVNGPKESAILYGGRDSFIPYYKEANGQYECVELLPEDNDSGTELRNIAATTIPKYSKKVASAIIYTTNKLLN